MKPIGTTRYAVVSPVRDEAEYLEHTIRSMVRQTVLPTQWIVVDDGSTDGTGAIIDRWASQYPWITPVRRADRGRPEHGSSRGHRAREAKEIQAFYGGYDHITAADWEFLVKIDGDVGFEADYFEKCLAEFNADLRLGIGGGTICNVIEGKLEPELTPQFHVRGATKIYRRACWEEIGGIGRGAAWDTLDEVKANMLGWHTRTFSHLQVAHYRYTGAANGGWNNAVKNGLWSYVAGYHPLFMAARCVHQLTRKPYILRSIGLMYGFVGGWLRRIPNSADKEEIQYVRNQQLRRLSFRSNIWQ